MASLISGYEYDIFISYRQKDNKHDGWVTEFVDNLRGELESTFKEEVSVYFDINPHDGLLETHDVDASLKDKLKCLVFIPIISRTYCDPKSFAWEHEFKAFVEQSSKDRYGLKVKLPGGNVASRVLPIKIYELDTSDIKLCESVLGGILRGVEFIYSEPGVNRPIKPDDDEKINLNKTRYRNQINKVGNAIKDVIRGLEQYSPQYEEVSKEINKPLPISQGKNKTKIIAGSLIALALIILGFFFIPKLIKPKEQLEKSIAVLPFKLLSDEPDKQYLADGMMDAITLHLSKIKNLRVVSRTSVEQYRGTIKTTRQIGKELDVEYLLEGSFQKFGDNARLIVQLIKASEESHVWANEYNNKWSEVFSLQSQVAQKIASEMNAYISPEEKQIIEKVPTLNLNAYDYYLKGTEEMYKLGIGMIDREAVKKGEILFKKALEIDSTFALAYCGLAGVYWKKAYWEENSSKHFMDSLLAYANIAVSYNDKLAVAYSLRSGYYAEVDNNLNKAIEELDIAIKLDPNSWVAYNEKGKYYWWMGDHIGEIGNRQKAISLNHSEQLPELLTWLGNSYISAGFPAQANYYYHEAFKLNGDSLSYLYKLASVESTQGNYKKALEFLETINVMDSTSEGLDHGLLLDITYEGLDRALALDYMYDGQFGKSLKYLKKWVERLKTNGEINTTEMYLIGFIYWVNGYKKEANFYFDKQGEYSLDFIKKHGPSAILGKYFNNHHYLAGIYAFRGNKEEAYKNLRISSQRNSYDFQVVTMIKNDPLFNSLRNEHEFQQIIRDVEAKYQADHERTRKWLEEQEKNPK